MCTWNAVRAAARGAGLVGTIGERSQEAGGVLSQAISGGETHVDSFLAWSFAHLVPCGTAVGGPGGLPGNSSLQSDP